MKQRNIATHLPNHKENSFNSFFIFLFIAFFFPSFNKYLDSIGAILVNSLIIFLSILFILSKWRFVVLSLNNPIVRFFIYCQMFFMLLLPISMSIGILFEVTPILRDTFEFHRPVLYSLIFFVSYICFHRNPLSDVALQQFLLFIFLLLCFFSYAQYNHLFPDLLSLYTKSHNIRSGRSSAPFGNPYDLAFIATFFIFYFFMKIIYARTLFFKGIGYVALFISAFLLLLATQSRSVAIGLLVTIGCVVPLFFLYFNLGGIKRLRIKKSLFVFMILFFISILVFILSIPYIQENFRYMYSPFGELASGEGTSTGMKRLEQMVFTLDRAQNPLILVFGNGPAKDMMEYVETIYTYLLFRYGLLGLFIYFFQWFLAVVVNFKILRMIGTQNKNFAFYAAIMIWLLTIPLSSIGNNLTEQIRSSFFYYSIFGILTAKYTFEKHRVLS